MATLSKELCENIIQNGGWYVGPTGERDHFRVSKIVTYKNAFTGSLSWAAVYEHHHQDTYERSGHCADVKTIWLASEYDARKAAEEKKES